MSRTPSPARRVLPLAVLTSLALAACSGLGSGASSTDTSRSGAPAAGVGRTLTVFAAASLQQTFTRLGTDFERAHPGTTVRFSFAGSSDLVAQLEQGAPADVLATADRRTMTTAVDRHLVSGDPRVFATNTLVVVTPPDNPKGVAHLADLARPGTQVVVCAPTVPCGAATRKVTTTAGVRLHPVSEERAVTDVLGKVVAGDADAGLVYATDARRAGATVATVTLPESGEAVNAYPVAPTATTEQQEQARAFVDLVTGPQGQQVLRQAGFGAP